MAFPRLQELATTQNSNSLTGAMSVYIERKINEDLHFAAGLSHLWEVLYSRVNEHRLLIAELNVFSGPLALQCAEFFKQLSQTEVLKMLEIRKSIMEILMIPVRLYLLLYYVHGDDEVGTWVILIQMSHLLHLEGKLFEWRGSLFLVCLDDFGSSEFTIYEMMIRCSVWMVRYRVHTGDFMTPFPEAARPKTQFIIGCGLFVGTKRVVQVDPVLVVGARCFDPDLGFSGFVIAAFLKLDPRLPLYNL
ncbi:hypothetical protein Tco_0471937 [Tanacetum coccineum]